jgi:hypothetical protein
MVESPEVTNPTDVSEVETAEDLALEADAAQEQVRLGIYVSAIRCLVTYALAPALGTAGTMTGFLGVAGVALQILGAVLCTMGAIRLWKLGHRLRYLYAVIAAAVYVVTALTLIGLA